MTLTEIKPYLRNNPFLLDCKEKNALSICGVLRVVNCKDPARIVSMSEGPGAGSRKRKFDQKLPSQIILFGLKLTAEVF